MMYEWHRWASGALLGLVLGGCSKVSNPGSDSGSSASGPPPDGTYVLDFTGSEVGGLHRGRFVNVAFAIDLSQPVRSFAFSNDKYQVAPGFISWYDFSGCDDGSELLMEKSVVDLDPGEPARVEYVDLEMLPRSHDTPDYQGSACFGYREPGGGWHWKFETYPVLYDTATERLRARIPIDRGPMDAVKIIFGGNDEMHVMTTISYAAQPDAAAAP